MTNDDGKDKLLDEFAYALWMVGNMDTEYDKEMWWKDHDATWQRAADHVEARSLTRTAEVGAELPTYQTMRDCPSASSLGHPVGTETVTPPATPDRAAEEPTDAQLRPFGWAPGGYVYICQDCGRGGRDEIGTVLGDKRSPRCRPCAVKAFKAAATTSSNHPVGVDEASALWFELTRGSGYPGANQIIKIDKAMLRAALGAVDCRPASDAAPLTEEMVDVAATAFIRDVTGNPAAQALFYTRRGVRAALEAALASRPAPTRWVASAASWWAARALLIAIEHAETTPPDLDDKGY